MQRIGFIGLGIMGKPMAKNILKAGFPLVVHSRSRGPVEELVAAGAEAASSPREVAERSDVVLTMLPDSPDVELVALGPSGIVEAARPGLTLIDMSTISPAITRKVAAALAARGGAMLDAPVSGSDKFAIAGTLSIMVGGDEAVFEACLPVLKAMGKTIVRVGSIGEGEIVKLCNNIVVGGTLLAVCEGLIFGAKAGVDLKKMVQAISGGAAQSWQLEVNGNKLVNRDFSPGFHIRLMQKDLRIALSMADQLDVTLPVISLVKQLFQGVEGMGHATDGTQAIIVALEQLSGVRVGEQVAS
ncbi:MAG: NAD-binding protein [Chloroflexi bacterium]|nr:NAD-binding protein [Chloroflexota bacterium]